MTSNKRLADHCLEPDDWPTGTILVKLTLWEFQDAPP